MAWYLNNSFHYHFGNLTDAFQEDTDDFTAFMAEAAASASDDWGQRIKF